MKQVFNRGILRSIRQSLGRFLAIAIIAALGTGFFAGLQMTAPDMKLAGDMYYDDTNLCDIRVMSTLGLNDDQIEVIANVEGVEGVMPAYETDIVSLIDGQQYTIRVHSLDVEAAEKSDVSDGKRAVSDDKNYINRPLLVEGTWPQAPDECLLAADAVMETNVQIGDTIEVTECVTDIDDTLVTRTFTIVGFARSSYYTSALTIGSTSLGTGAINQFMYVPTQAFQEGLPYTEAFVTVDGAKGYNSSSEEYEAYVGTVEQRIDDVAPQIQAERLAQVKEEAQSELDANKEDFERERQEAEQQLDDAKLKLDEAESKLSAAKTKLDNSSISLQNSSGQLNAAHGAIQDSEEKLAHAQALYDQGVKELEDKRSQAEAQFAQAQAKIDDGQKAYDEAMGKRAELVEQRAGLIQQRDALQGQYDASPLTVEQVDQQIATVTTSLSAVNEQIANLEQNDPTNPSLPGLRQQKTDLETTLATLNQTRVQLQALLDGIAQLNGGIAQIDQGIAQIDAQTAGVPEQLASSQTELDAQKETAYAEFDKAEAKLAESKAQLDAGYAQLDAVKAQYRQGRAAYDKGMGLYNSGLEEYNTGVKDYNTGVAEYNDKKAEADTKFADAEQEIDDAQAKIDAIELPDVYVLDRSKNMGVQSFFADADRIHQIAQVFPFIFFLVAALVSLTTMTRMVEEERVLIGTYKALGYSSLRITSKYLIYAIIASGTGSIIGILAMSQFLPWFIMNAYGIVYAVPIKPTPIDFGIASFSTLLGVGITVAATWFAAGSTLRERPAQLMLPRAPKAGKRILLERITPLWHRMSFLWKVTARNIFRYKRRFFMAVIGVAGCTALLLTGLGLQNAINDIIDKQFGELYHYTMLVTSDEDATEEDKAEIESILTEGNLVSGYTHVAIYNMIACQEGSIDQRFELVVPQDADGFESFITLRQRQGHEPLSLDNEGVIVSEKMADMYGLEIGDNLVVYEQDLIGNAKGSGYELPIVGITEHYVNQYVYMTPEVYEKTFGEPPAFNTILADAGDDSDGRSLLSDELLNHGMVKTVGYNDETIDTYRTMLKSVDAVVIVLVVAAALLAFVVLYNLTNINITERQREIATLKVLGFTPHEVNAYIYRETILLSMIGALVGLVLGIFMEGFVVVTAEVDMVMFGREIHAMSYLIAFVLTMLFSIFVAFAARRKLDKIDMVESMKSVE